MRCNKKMISQIQLKHFFEIQCPPLIWITLGQRKINNNNRMLTVGCYVLFRHYPNICSNLAASCQYMYLWLYQRHPGNGYQVGVPPFVIGLNGTKTLSFKTAFVIIKNTKFLSNDRIGQRSCCHFLHVVKGHLEVNFSQS